LKFKGSKVQLPAAFKGSIACGVKRIKVQLPAAFKGSIACGVKRIKVQLPAAFKGSIACGVQRFEAIWNLVLGIWILEFGSWPFPNP